MKDKIRQTIDYLRATMRGKTLVLALVLSLSIFFFLGVINNFVLFFSALFTGNFLLVWGLIVGIFTSQMWFSIVSVLIVSVLTGINLALIITRARQLRSTGATGVAAFFGMLISGCPSCATGILPVLGIGVGFLPFHGLEFSALAIIILLVSLYWNAQSGQCKI